MAISILHRADVVRSSGRTVGGRRLAVLGCFVVVTIAGGALALSRSALFAVRTIEVIGVEHLSPDRIRALADVRRGAALLWMDIAAVESRVEQTPWVADAMVDRVLPWTLSIRVRERAPVAVVSTSGPEVLVAPDGTLLGRARPNVPLPRLILPASTASSGVARLARVVRWLPAAVRPGVESLRLRDGGSVVLTIAGGPTVEFGAVDDLRAKGQALRHVLAWVRRQDVSVDRISLVSPGAPAVSLSG